MEKRLLDILCCPLTKAPLRPLTADEVAAANREIATGAVVRHDGESVTATLTEGLVTRDGQRVYRIDDGVPVMLVDESIAAAQLSLPS